MISNQEIRALAVLRIRLLILRFLASKFMLRVLGDVPRDLLDVKRGFSYVIEENGELELIRKVCSLSEPASVIFDGGANIGDYSQALLDSQFAGKIHLFEINSTLIDQLKLRFYRNSRVIVNNLGLSNVQEVRKFIRWTDYSGGNSLHKINYAHLSGVESLATLENGDSYCQSRLIDRVLFLKLDIEGWERYALTGFDQMFRSKNIDIVSWEYGYVSAEAGWTSRDFFKYFESLGYACGVIRKMGVHFQKWDYSLNDWKSGPNFVACLPEFIGALESFS